MPACFALTRKGESSPAHIPSIDDAMRVHFGAPPHETEWYLGWYDILGLAFAMGASMSDVRDTAIEWYPHLVPVAEWLDANYTVEAWTEVGRR
jgi:hypothetical protein